MSHSSHHGRRALVAMVAACCLAVMGVASVSAHPHTVKGGEVIIANGQNHPPFPGGGGTSCEEFGAFDPAWYGLESAHHGPDAGDPGKGRDGCYQTTGNVPPGEDDENPAID